VLGNRRRVNDEKLPADPFLQEQGPRWSSAAVVVHFAKQRGESPLVKYLNELGIVEGVRLDDGCLDHLADCIRLS
jgi:hypothetical protein